MTSAPHSPVVVGAQFQPARPVHDYDAGGLDLARRERVVVEVPDATARATIACPPAVVRRADGGVEVAVTLEDLVEKRAD